MTAAIVAGCLVVAGAIAAWLMRDKPEPWPEARAAKIKLPKRKPAKKRKRAK